MAVTQCRAWECEVCGWRWMYTEDRTPLRCPSCGSRRWNGTANDDARGAGRGSEGKTGGAGKPDSVPVLRTAEGAKKHLRPVQSVRDKLAGRGDAPAQLSEPESVGVPVGSDACPHGAKNRFICAAHGGPCGESGIRSCPECHALNGNHFRGCKRQ